MRLAALFQVVCEGGSEISLEVVQRAWAIVQWSLTQYQLVFVEAIQPEPKFVRFVARPTGPFTNPWPAKPKPVKRPRPIQDAQLFLDCLISAGRGQGRALLREVALLAGLRGARLQAAMAWLKHYGAIETTGRDEDAMVRMLAVPACEPPGFLHLSW